MKLLDLFCGAGGCAVGYHRAGFTEILGVDIEPQPRYPYPFHQGGALDFLRGVKAGDYDLIHASPPCQAYSVARHLNGLKHPDLVAAVRAALEETGTPYVIENVLGAPLRNPVIVCGLTLGLKVKRHRLFECSLPVLVPPCPPGHPGEWYTVYGDGGSHIREGRPRDAKGELARRAMGIDWMNRRELSQAIPPAYTEWIGRQLIGALA